MKRMRLDPDKLTQARHSAGYSLRELGEILGAPNHNRLWEYEHGRRNPHPRNIRKIAEALGVEVRDLLQESEET